MRLRDEVQIIAAGEVYDPYLDEYTYDWAIPTVEATVPAEVGHTGIQTPTEVGRMMIVEELRCVIAPYPLDPVTHRIRWRGVDHKVDGVMVRRHNGADHHLTAKLELVSG